MPSFHKKQRVKTFILSKVALLVLGVLTALLSMATWDVFQKARETEVRREQHEAELADLEEREAALRHELERLETPRGLEEEIRNKFDVAREGEGVIVVVDPRENSEQAAMVKNQSFWSRFIDIFSRD